jgi:NTP pyrophosphatase (non-canonical NTP hydrolase)
MKTTKKQAKTRRKPPSAATDRLLALTNAAREFNRERDWQIFHSPKNLAMAIAIEAAELMEPFRWDTPEQAWHRASSPEGLEYVRSEMADVLLLLVSMADYLGVDLVDEAFRKLQRNGTRYPVDRARGRADKYTAYATGAARTATPKRGDKASPRSPSPPSPGASRPHARAAGTHRPDRASP